MTRAHKYFKFERKDYILGALKKSKGCPEIIFIFVYPNQRTVNVECKTLGELRSEHIKTM